MKKFLGDALSKMKDSAEWDSLKKQAKAHGSKAWLGGVAVLGDMSKAISQSDFVSKINTYKSEVSKAMDSGLDLGSIDPETGLKMSLNNHRILDGGHGFFESINKAQEVGVEQGWSPIETFGEWSKSYFSDLSSPAGMPVFDGLTDNAYAFLRNIGIDDTTARDLVTINGQEAIESIVGGSFATIALVFAWKNEDKENFSRAIGALGLGSLIAVNPVVMVIVLAALGLGYNSLVCKKAVERGAVVTGVAMGTSMLIPGPILLGVIPAIVLAVYVNKKMGKDFDFTGELKRIYEILKTQEGRAKVVESLDKIIENLHTRVAKKAA